MELVELLKLTDSSSFDDAVKAFKSTHAGDTELEELLTQVGLSFLAEYDSQVEIFVEHPTNNHYLLRRRSANSTKDSPEFATCDCFDGDDCERCELDEEKGFQSLLDAVLSAVNGLYGVKQPRFKALLQKHNEQA